MSKTNNSTPNVPSHIGLIIDGNRRWAKAQGLQTLEGHKKGYKNLIDRADFLIDQGVEFVSAYVFSTENWNRTREEVKYLMDLALFVATKEVKRLNEKNIRLIWIGREEKLSAKLVKAIRQAEELTKDNQRGTLCLCLNYGGRHEISDAVRDIINSQVKADKVTPELIAEHLYQPEIPDLDLVVRTSGEHRISNFMLWRIAYSELMFIEKLWPEINDDDLNAVLKDYSKRQRRFGG